MVEKKNRSKKFSNLKSQISKKIDLKIFQNKKKSKFFGEKKNEEKKTKKNVFFLFFSSFLNPQAKSSLAIHLPIKGNRLK